MKVFVSGSQSIKKLPNAAVTEIRRLASDGHTILIGDEPGFDKVAQQFLVERGYENVAIYSGSTERPRSRSKSSRRRRSLSRKTFFRRCPQDADMAADADRGLVIWDASSRGSFFNLVDLLWRGKPVNLCTPCDSKKDVYKTVSLVELKDLIPYAGMVSSDPPPFLKDEILRTCIPFDATHAALERRNLDLVALGEIVRFAPIALDCKLEMLQKLAAHENVLRDLLDSLIEAQDTPRLKDNADWGNRKLEYLVSRSLEMQVTNIEKALENLSLKPGEILLLGEMGFEEGLNEERIYGFSPFADFDAILTYIRSELPEIVESRTDEDGCIENNVENRDSDECAFWWYEIEKWTPGDAGNMRHEWTYYLIEDKVIFFKELESQDSDFPFGFDLDLNRHISFPTGTLLEIDLRPFVPPFHALVLEPQQDIFPDDCYPTVLLRQMNGLWGTSSLNLSMLSRFWFAVPTLISPLYRARSIDAAQLTPDEEVLIDAQNALGGNSERGSAFWNALHDAPNRPLNNDDLRSLIKKFEESYGTQSEDANLLTQDKL